MMRQGVRALVGRLGRGNRKFATVAEVTLKVAFIDHEGSRVVVPGLIGQTLAEVAEMHSIDIGPVSAGGDREVIHNERWTEDVYGEGPVLGFDHVQIPPAWHTTLPPRTDYETQLLLTFWDGNEITEASRLASVIKLDKRHDGIQVYIPDGIPADGQV